MAEKKPPEKEYTVEELVNKKDFPYRERTIRDLIKKGVLKAKYYGYQKMTIPESEIENF